ncbi:MAG: HAMP domain-containing sensor histidine kinase [Thermaerobacter sp.]|nr:HAMP domain-containing sensor histidine kinase [Thermaerobacter sp.]
MNWRRLIARLGPRLLLSYVLASLAGAVSGMAAAFFVPPEIYQQLMLKIMYPPPGETLRQMDALLAKAIAQAVVVHVALSIAVAIGVSIVVAAYVSRQIAGALARVTHVTRQLGGGDFARRLPSEDIEEISELVRDVNSLAQSLEEAERQRGLAISSVSHELRTPLTALRAYCDAVREGILEMTPDVLERMSCSIDRLERMAGDLSSLARAEAQLHHELTLTALAVPEVLDAAYESMRMVFDGTGVEFRREGATGEGCTVHADAARLGEVLENLLSNSLAHTPKGKRVSLSAQVHGSEVELCIRDEGKGIRREDLPHVTEPFFRGEGRTPRPGMGLGLAISSRLVRAMGGRLVIESPGEGQGTTARIVLPCSLRKT